MLRGSAPSGHSRRSHALSPHGYMVGKWWRTCPAPPPFPPHHPQWARLRLNEGRIPALLRPTDAAPTQPMRSGSPVQPHAVHTVTRPPAARSPQGVSVRWSCLPSPTASLPRTSAPAHPSPSISDSTPQFVAHLAFVWQCCRARQLPPAGSGRATESTCPHSWVNEPH